VRSSDTIQADVADDLIADLPDVLPRNARTDTQLLERTAGGDEAAFEQIYYRWHKPLHNFMLRAIHSPADAEDIVQDTFAKLWMMREKIDPSKNIQSLIFVIARRAAIDLYRRTGRITRHTADEMGALPNLSLDHSPQEIIEARETELLLQIAVMNMPDRQREVFSLYYYDHLSLAEIATRMELSYENVRKHVYNAKRQLRDLISLIVLFLMDKM
jgi:RNA polymerase sigma-70 factor (ECF subfamily)